MKCLEIGPSPKRKIGPEWDTMDIMSEYNPTYTHDVKDPMPMIADNTYDLVYLSHVLEHVPWNKTEAVLKELYRILKPGGSIEIWVPDFEKIVKCYLTKEFPDGWRMLNPKHDVEKWWLGRLFAHDRDGTNDWNFHRSAFDEPYLKKCILEAGFKSTAKLTKTRTVDHGYVNLGMKGIK